MSMMIMSSISLMLSSILMSLILMISKKSKENEQMKLSFECGFSSQSPKNNPISPHFFLITMLFLIFDVEISILLPILMNQSNNEIQKLNLIVITLIFFLATMMEWNLGMIEWIK